MELYRLTIHEAGKLLKKGEISSVELTSAVFDRIEAVEDKVSAYLTLVKDRAMAQAEVADDLIRCGEGGPLTGIPLAIKDILCTEGIRTTCGSKILENFTPPYSSTVVKKLSEEEQEALRTVLGQGGQMVWEDFDARYGNDLEESRYWQWHTPETTMGRLRLRGFLVEATVGDELHIVVPVDLREGLRGVLG